MRFHQGRDVIDLPPGVPLEGLEFSPKVKVTLLSFGGALYLGLLGLVVAVHTTNNARTDGDPHLELVTHEQAGSVISLSRSLGAVKVEKF